MDEVYVHIDVDNEYYVVELEPKNNTDSLELYNRFENELIAQGTRLFIAKRTKNIREMIVARSLASTMINTNESEALEDSEYDADDILTDWYEKYE